MCNFYDSFVVTGKLKNQFDLQMRPGITTLRSHKTNQQVQQATKPIF